MAKKQKPIQWGDSPKSQEQGKVEAARLRRIADSIRAEAKGKVCGDCFWFRGNVCDYFAGNYQNGSYIGTPQAVACRRWTKATEKP